MLKKLSKISGIAMMVLILPQMVWAQTSWNLHSVQQDASWQTDHAVHRYDDMPEVEVMTTSLTSENLKQVSKKTVQTKNGLMPTKATVTSKYGRRLHPVSKRYRMHQGVDYAAPSGTPILAPASGIVSFVGNKGGYGKTVMLRHNASQETLYAHMSRYVQGVKVGTSVQKGEVIGYVGSTGMSTGPHLHFEVWKNGKRVNPTSVNFSKSSVSQSEFLRVNDMEKPAYWQTM